MRNRDHSRACRLAESHLDALGRFIRHQRELARMSLRQLAELAEVSNPYLSQIERGIHRPSADVLRALAGPLGVSPRTLYAKAGLLEEDGTTSTGPDVEEAIRLDSQLSDAQKKALLQVYRVLKAAS